MSLIARWDIRLESYTDGASVTSLTDRAGTYNLTSNASSTGGFPTYSSSETAINFTAGNRAIGIASSTLADVLGGTDWSMFVLVKTPTSFGSGFIGGFGYSGDFDQGVLLQDTAAGTGFVRDTFSTVDTQASTGTRSTGTWYVLHIVRAGSTIYVGYDGANVGSQTIDGAISSDAFDQFALGAYWRNTIGSYFNGYIREFRIYDSDERSNYASIVSAMSSGASAPVLSGGSPTSTTSSNPTLSCTTNTSSGTARIVVDTAANLDTVTATQVLAGQNDGGSAALKDSGNITVSTTTISTTAITGLASGTYTVAAAQTNGSNSNVQKWTLVVDRAGILTLTLRDTDTGVLKNAVTYGNVHIFADSAPGTLLLSLTSQTTNASGVLTLTDQAMVNGTAYTAVGFNSGITDVFVAKGTATE